MKRMVKNGDLLDISEDGSSVSFGGNLKVGGTIIANGEIRGGDVSASKFYLGTEEMPLVKANPAGDATGTLEKIKIGDVAYNVGGGSSNDREITLIAPYDKTTGSKELKIYIDEHTWNKIKSCYYETIKIYFKDGNPLGIFHPFCYYYGQLKSFQYACVSDSAQTNTSITWYGESNYASYAAKILTYSDATGKYITLSNFYYIYSYTLDQSKFDDLYKLADKPTGDGTYVLKATVSGGAVTYTWVAE